jgi:hypothetical protein
MAARPRGRPPGRAEERVRHLSQRAQAELHPKRRRKYRRRPLSDDPDRFAIVVLSLLLEGPFSRFSATRPAMILTGPFSWASFRQVDDHLLQLTASHVTKAVDLDNKAEALLAKAEKLIARIFLAKSYSKDSAADYRWFTASRELLTRQR